MSSPLRRSHLRMLVFCLGVVALAAFAPVCTHAQTRAVEPCPRPAIGSAVSQPADLRSENGVLKADLIYRDYVDAAGHTRFCYLSQDGSQAPTLRVNPGDLLILSLKNELSAPNQPAVSMAMTPSATPASDACASGEMTSNSTNLHFHGLTVPPVCHADDVLKTWIQPGDPPFEYRFQIPPDQPPGLYWYHPHVHGFTKVQVLGGASGALIVEGIERANRNLAGLPERVFVIRDRDLLNPNAQPAKNDSAIAPPVILDSEGDVMNTGTGTGKPAKDLSINYVPVPYPDYAPALIQMKPSAKEFWRVLNASAITYLNLEVSYKGTIQPLGVVALDGAPINENGVTSGRVIWQKHVGVPPGGRIEFTLKAPPEGVTGSLITLSVNTGTGGENDPIRPLANIAATDQAPEPASKLSSNPSPLPPPTTVWLGDVKPSRTRKLFFSETLQDPSDPNSPTTFYLTVDGETPKVFDPHSAIPNIIVQQGDVEDWIIENRSQELHAFHIHQIHFMVLQWFGLPVNEPYLRDTVNVPFWDGKAKVYPMVKLRMDFRDPNAVGTFVYHCHLLEHEDGGMMGLVQVEPRKQEPGAK